MDFRKATGLNNTTKGLMEKAQGSSEILRKATGLNNTTKGLVEKALERTHGAKEKSKYLMDFSGLGIARMRNFRKKPTDESCELGRNPRHHRFLQAILMRLPYAMEQLRKYASTFFTYKRISFAKIDRFGSSSSFQKLDTFIEMYNSLINGMDHEHIRLFSGRIHEKASPLRLAVINNHAFLDENKRAGYDLVADTVSTAGDVSLDMLESWIASNVNEK
ncbi:1154_t:CDS:2 [Ambispora gerdemannii]|uniref:1154_t:CDS:1 n=1 Tax=Ambispora gerdemannii TaxID=144530 RepID=A0A9N9GDI5_9GLOM|nr:1154_t:CDS:2 [Ambispora gerdemannii]